MAESLCELCCARGVKSQLVLFQLNLDEAILLCKNKECVYPLGATHNSNLFVRRKYSEISNSKRRRKKKEQNKKQRDLQTHKDVPVTTRCLDSYLQWQNTGTLCWLDSVLSLFAHNVTLYVSLQKQIQSENYLLRTLCESFYKAQELCAVDRAQAEKVLEDVRESVWRYLQPKMKCQRDVNDSAAAALPLLLRESSILTEKTLQEHHWQFNCSSCGYQQIDKRKKHLITFPNVTSEFCLEDAVFVRSCYNCGVSGQTSKLVYERMPQCIFMHFENGLKSDHILHQNVKGEDGHYNVTQLIQYKRNPDHFICWTKEHQGSRWMEMDDLNSPLCSWITTAPTIPPSEIHIVVWEKHSTDLNNLVTQTTKSFTGLNMSIFEDVQEKEVKTECCSALKIDCKDSVSLPGGKGSVEASAPRSPVLSLLTPVRTAALLPSVPQKTKAGPLHFEPYIPRKKRLVSLSCPSSPLCLNNSKLDSDKNVITPLPSPSSLSFLSWQDLTEQSKVKMNHDDLQSDSGYSSPASVSSCSSLPPGQTGLGLLATDSWDYMQLDEKHDEVHCASELMVSECPKSGHQAQPWNDTARHKEEVNDLADKLEELLPDCLLENPTSLVESVEHDANTTLSEFEKLSAEQDQFIFDLLAT